MVMLYNIVNFLEKSKGNFIFFKIIVDLLGLASGKWEKRLN
jgi:hypothetical protein